MVILELHGEDIDMMLWTNAYFFYRSRGLGLEPTGPFALGSPHLQNKVYLASYEFIFTYMLYSRGWERYITICEI